MPSFIYRIFWHQTYLDCFIRNYIVNHSIVWFFIVLALCSAAVSQANENGENVYNGNCKNCHATGTLGAPLLGSKSAWETRLKQGNQVLLQHVLDGFNAMPAKGGNPQLQESDIRDALVFMLSEMLSELLHPGAVDTLESQKKFFRQGELGKPYLYPMDEQGYFQPPSLEELPNDKYGDEVRLGYKIFTETPKYASRFAGRGLVCSHCHLDAGRKSHAVPLWGGAGMYPGYRFSSDKNDTLEDRMADCFRNSLNGIAPPPDSPEMRALLAYANYISKGVPIGVHMPGRSFPDIDYTGYEASPTRGKDIFEKKCASCHGKDGQGSRRTDGSYEYPPLWGLNSYNKGASLYKQRKLARFIRANMPLGKGFTLSEQEAWDLASFVNMHERPKSPATGILVEIFGKQ
jgi:thiosulfate dehydrogenase